MFSSVPEVPSLGMPSPEIWESMNEAKQNQMNIMTIFSCFIYGIGGIFAIIGIVLYFKDKEYQKSFHE